jgi:hypothetical protein
MMAQSLHLPRLVEILAHQKVTIRPKSGHIQPSRFFLLNFQSSLHPWQPTGPALHDLQPRDVFRELLQEKQLHSDELSAVFDELLALREAKLTS